MNDADRELIAAAQAARERAYAPYSRYAVGAALRGVSGRIYLGVNVENAAYPMTICAERAALVTAIGQGQRDFRAIAVARGDGAPISPCGMCRQSLADFAPLDVVYRSQGGLVRVPLSRLLPDAFLFEGDA